MFGDKYGNFEFSSSMETLVMWMQKIVSAIREGFSYDSHDTLYESQGGFLIVANIDILITLMEQYGTNPDLTVEEVTKWKEDYLATYDRVMLPNSSAEDAEDYEKRRAVIETTFDRLHILVKKSWEDFEPPLALD